MISAIFIYNAKGDLLISKLIKDHVKRSLADVFRTQVINDPHVRSPILTLGSTTFQHVIRESSDNLPMWLVAVSRSNVDSSMIWEYLHKLYQLMEAFGINDEDVLKDEFMLLYEILELTLENGIPQTTDLAQIIPRVSRKPIENNTTSKSTDLDDFLSGSSILKAPKLSKRSSSSIALSSLSECPWRPSGLKYKKNEVYLDINEKITILVGKDGSIVKSFVDGSVDCVSHLSGMPLCQLGLNDTYSIHGNEKSELSIVEMMSEYDIKNKKAIPNAAAGSVILEDCKFHQCVQLNKYEANRVIQFVPPDGPFQLMQYRVIDNINIPFNVIPEVEIVKNSILNYKVTLRSLYPSNVSAKDVTVKIPVPPTTIKCDFNVSGGKCKYDAGEKCMIWKYNKYKGSTENTLSAKVAIPATSHDLSDLLRWSRPPISMGFEIVMFSNSGLVVRHLKCQEPQLNYQPVKWIKYISHSGAYEIRY
ncbi:Apm4 [Kluyveromyces lactis]|nr:Apm4 [Kluyveromyces lactis]